MLEIKCDNISQKNRSPHFSIFDMCDISEDGHCGPKCGRNIMKYQMVFIIICAINLNKYLYISDGLKGILILDIHLYLSNLAFIKLSINASDTFYYGKHDIVCIVNHSEIF